MEQMTLPASPAKRPGDELITSWYRLPAFHQWMYDSRYCTLTFLPKENSHDEERQQIDARHDA